MQQRRAKHPPSCRAPGLDPLEPRRLFATSPITTTTLAPIPGPVSVADSITLTATVTSDGAVAPAGSVAFLGVFEKGSAPAGKTKVATSFQALQSSDTIVLGHATLQPDGRATLVLISPPLGNYSVAAQYLGTTPALYPASPAAAAGTDIFAPLNDLSPVYDVDTWDPIPKSTVFYPDGRPFSLHFGVLTYLDSVPPGVVPSGQPAFSQDDYVSDSLRDSPPAYFNPATAPFRLTADSVRTGEYFDPITHFSYTFSAIGIPPLTPYSTTGNASPSLSYKHQISVIPPTRLTSTVAASRSVANPPAIAFNLFSTDGARLSLSTAEPTERGTILSAKAGVVIHDTAPSPSSGAGSAMGEAGYLLIDRAYPDDYRKWFMTRPTGTVSIYENATLVATITLAIDGNAIWTPQPGALSTGTHALRAVYSGDAKFASSSVDIPAFTLTPASTHVELSTYTPYTEVFGHRISRDNSLGLIATVTGDDPTLVAPTGDVQFFHDESIVASLPLGSRDHELALPLSDGRHIIAASYPGNAFFIGSGIISLLTTTTAEPHVFAWAPTRHYELSNTTSYDHPLTAADIAAFIALYVNPPPPQTPTLPPLAPTVTPDLAGSIVPAKPVITPGTPSSLTLTLTNPSATTAIRRKYAVSYYFSTDRIFSDDDTRFSKQTLQLNLAAKQSKSFPLNYKLPSAAPLRGHFLIAVADPVGTDDPAAHLHLASRSVVRFMDARLSAAIRSVKPGPTASSSRITVRVTNTGNAPFSTKSFITLQLFAGNPANPILTVKKSPALKVGKFTDYIFMVPGKSSTAPFSVALLTT